MTKTTPQFDRSTATCRITQTDWNKLVAATRRVAGSTQDAEDAVQIACLRAWQTGVFRGDSTLTTYLTRAARNMALNQHVAARTRKRGGGWVRVDMPALVSTADPCLAAQYWRKCDGY